MPNDLPAALRDFADRVHVLEPATVVGELETLRVQALRNVLLPISTQPSEERLLTLEQAREWLQVRSLPRDLPTVKLSRKVVRVRPRDLQRYAEHHLVG